MTGWGGGIGTKLETRHLMEKALKISIANQIWNHEVF